MAEKKTTLLLKITEPSGTVREEEVDKDSVIVGSGASANVRIEDPKVSSIHMMLKIEKNGEVHAIDLGSETGTKLKGTAITDATALASGDVVEIGATKIRVAFGEAGSTEVLSVPPFSGEKEAVEAAEKGGKKDKKENKAPPPPPPAAKGGKGKHAGASRLGGLRGRSATSIFYEELPPEAKPTANERALDVAMIWGDAIIEATQFNGGTVTVGAADGNNFKVYLDGVEKHVLATVNGAQASLSAPAGGTIVVRKNGKDEKVGSTATIGLEERARIQVGSVEFVARFMKPAARMKTGFLEQIDLYFTKVLSISVMAHVIVLAAMLITPLDSALLSEDLFRNPNRYTKLILKAPEKKKLDLSGI